MNARPLVLSALGVAAVPVLWRWCRRRPCPPAGSRLLGCEQLVPTEVVQALFSQSVVFMGSPPNPLTADAFSDEPAKTAFASALRWQRCWWGVPNSDGSVGIEIVELPATAAATFLAALGGSAWTPTPVAGRQGFWSAEDNLLGSVVSLYVLVGPFWVTVRMPSIESARPAAAVAVATLSAANPGI